MFGWEELPAERRDAWRRELLSIATADPLLQLAVTLPPAEPPWPGFTALAVASTSDRLLERWIECLVPAQQRAQLLAASCLRAAGAQHVPGAWLPRPVCSFSPCAFLDVDPTSI